MVFENRFLVIFSKKEITTTNSNLARTQIIGTRVRNDPWGIKNQPRFTVPRTTR